MVSAAMIRSPERMRLSEGSVTVSVTLLVGAVDSGQF
jgi:hypothetical protein